MCIRDRVYHRVRVDVPHTCRRDLRLVLPHGGGQGAQLAVDVGYGYRVLDVYKRQAQLLHQCLGHIGDHGIGEPGVASLDGGGAVIRRGGGIVAGIGGILRVRLGAGTVAAHILAGDGKAVGEMCIRDRY